MGISAAGVLSQLFYLPYSHVIYQVCCLTGNSLLLVSMLIFIRKLKHEIFRYPLFMAYSPLILPLTYLLIYDVAILRDILFAGIGILPVLRSEEHTSELQSRGHLVCRLLLEKKNKTVC